MITNKKDLKRARRAGKLASECLDRLCNMVKPGVTPLEIDAECYKWTTQRDAVPAPLNYKGFPNSCCISVNDVICHGIPNSIPFKDGDVVKIDVTPKYQKWHGDTCRTVIVGEPDQERISLVLTAHEAMWYGIRAIKPGATLMDIANAVNDYIKSTKYSLVREYGGHGIGRTFHMEPFVAYHPDHVAGHQELKVGQVITIEPMINLGGHETKLEADGWTVRTVDGSLSAQFEHTVLVTEDGYEVLTNPT